MIGLIAFGMVLVYGVIQLSLLFSLRSRLRQASTEHTIAQREGYSLGLVIFPAGMLMLANAAYDYPWHEAGALGLWWVAGLSVLVALWHTRWLYRSKLNLLLIVAIVTLFVLMQATGRLDWSKVFSRPRTAPPPPKTLQPEVPAQA